MDYNYIDYNNTYIINKNSDFSTIEICLKICRDCVHILNTTKNPNIFFERYKLLISTTNELITVENKYKFYNQLPHQFKENLIEQERFVINDFINRYYNDFINRINNLKTEKGKTNFAKKFIDNIDLYYNLYNIDNLSHINNLYNSIIDDYKIINVRKKGYFYCIYCGKQIEYNSKFCIYCGKIIK